MQQKSRLGRGLNALIPQKATLNAGEGVRNIQVSSIVPNPYQPRQAMDDASLEELAASIRQFGVLQPVLVVSEAGEYQLISGHRRLAACKKAGLATIPAIIRDQNHQERLEISLVENVQRENLNPVEEAHAYQRLHEEFNIPLKDIAHRVGKKLPTVSNTLRLLSLPSAVLQGLTEGKTTEGHARALLGLVDPHLIEIAYGQILKDRLNVREVEDLVRKYLSTRLTGKTSKAQKQTLSRWDYQEKHLMDHLGARVHIQERQGKGTIALEFYSEEELTRLIELLLQVDD
ncbi:hypothetical protein AUK40_04405 [Candidatus Wirthbacteria bacterium CG2_30_54_11]|uniref:ParB-like N-terminal domain-containing protein n=1 Tax=Candidatus Wirthbacteria bacterium CG2_30_54_11 TaxID=1817892 RepID=A0A1J5IIL3_9BACT|nr:MAG: hypothetical protein AUK40_04405 [Candidatus Wirthbacteria bacterium CG2_30_54_11]